MKRFLVIVAVLVFGFAGRSYAWRDKVESLLPEKPVQIDGRATEWAELPVVEVGGLSLRAMNDSANLYLLIRGANPDGRVLLSGSYRQNVGIWFLKPDQKTKAWGITLDFNRAHAPEPAMENGHAVAREITSLSDMGITPEMVLPQGLEVSTSTFPADFAFQADLSSERGRQPIYEIQIPLSMIDRKGRSVFFDIASSDVSPEVKSELQNQKPSDNAGGASNAGGAAGGSSSGGHGGGMGRHGRGGGSGGSRGAAAVEIPKPIHLIFTVQLAKVPKA